MDIDLLRKKTDFLRRLDTKPLIEQIKGLEDAFEVTLREETTTRNLNHEYIASYGSDCQEVKGILAEVLQRMPPADEAGRKIANQEMREAWLMNQRKINQKLVAAINRQDNTTFQLDNCRIAIELAKKRLESARAVLQLKTAQIEFLTEK